MRWSVPAFSLVIVAALWAQPTVEQEDFTGDEAVLRGMNLPTKGAALLQVFRDRTPKSDTVQQFQKHVAKLGAPTFPERMKANDDLVKMGSVIRPLLESLIAQGNLDLETKRRVEQVLEQFPADKDIMALSAASRLLQRDKPADRLPVLFDFVPHATNEIVRQDVQLAINGASLENKMPAPLIVAMLKDTNPAKRAAAAEALVRAVGPAAAKEQIAPLMKDAHSLVRYQLGMALVEKHDKAGLPLLIQTIADETPDRVEYALDVLFRAAGETSPSEYYQGKRSAEKVAAAWRKWHEKNQAGIDLSKMDVRTDHGYTVISQNAIGVKGKTKIFELGPRPQASLRWEFEGMTTPYDFQILGPNRLLVAEYSGSRVTERDFKGSILKQFPAKFPTGCQRLPDGNTFIVTRQLLQIVDPDGKEVFSWQPAAKGVIMSAQRLRNGQIAVITGVNICQLLDAQGKELKRFNTGGNTSLVGANFEVLPNGRVLVPLYSQQMIAEYDWNGTKLWQAQVARPLSVTRLQNGNTLVTTSIAPYRVVEIDRNGQEVWSYQTEGRPMRARRR